jgi:lipoprotein-anchoring transpeptidase ErfK/SrfK
MEGGNLASDDFYRLEDVRNVSYIVGNVAIHGSYWHAKYGIAPQSRGCINATVHDAGLIHQLPIGTPVEVFY